MTRIDTTLPSTAVVLGCLSLAACGTDHREVRDVGDYERVSLEGTSEATLSGSSEVEPGTLLVECLEGTRDVQATVADAVLQVRAPGAGKDCAVWVHEPGLHSVAVLSGETADGRVALHLDGDGEVILDELVAGTVDVYVRGGARVEIDALDADDVDVDLSGGGSLWVGTATAEDLAILTRGNSDVVVDDLAVAHWELDTAGNTMLSADGMATRADIVADGGATIDAMAVTAQVAAIDAGGSAVVELTVEEEVDVTAGGSASVSIGGDPVESSVDASASAEVLGL